MNSPDDLTIVRDATPEDCLQISKIYNEAIREGESTMDRVLKSQKYFEGVIRHLGEREAMLVVDVRDAVAGWGILKSYSERLGYRTTCESSIYLVRDCRGRGFGSILQEELLVRCRRFRYHHVVAKINADNAGSIRFHQRFGFEPVGTQKEVGFVAGSWTDVMIMQAVFRDVPPFEPAADQSLV